MPSKPRRPSSGPSSRGKFPSSNQSADVRENARPHVRAHGIADEPLFVREQCGDVDEVDGSGVGAAAPSTLQNPRQFVEERLGRAFELIFETSPEQPAIGIGEHRLDAILEQRLFRLD